MTTMPGAKRIGPISAINVTPMADVMIVLLIVFMIATPILVTPVELPKAAHGRQESETGLVVTLGQDGRIRVGKELMASETLFITLKEGLEEVPEGLVLLKADAKLPYGEVKSVMNLCRRAGAKQVALMTKPERDRP